MDLKDFDDDLEITGAYSPLMVSQHSPSPKHQPPDGSPSPFVVNRETIDLTADDEETTSVLAPRNGETTNPAPSPPQCLKVALFPH